MTDATPFVIVLLKITLVLLLALGIARFLHRASAGSRHLVWLVALGALLALPPLAAWAPLQLRVLPAVQQVPPSSAMVVDLKDEGTVPSAPVRERSAAVPPATSTLPVDAGVPSLAVMFFWAWVAIAFALLLRLLFGVWAVQRIVRRAAPLEHPSWQRPLYEIADRLGLDAAPRLLRSEDVEMPFASGLFRTTIVLPAGSDGWSAERRSAVLIHELGHVRRRDLLGHTLSRIACALYWFHPLVWTAARRLRAESERACDDLALLFGARPSDYAEHLLEIVTSVRDHRAPAVALAMAHRSEFEGRMLAILDTGLTRRAPGRMASLSLVGAISVLAVLVSAAAPVRRDALVAADVPEPESLLQPPVEQKPTVVKKAEPATPRPAPTPKSKPAAAPVPQPQDVVQLATADSGADRAVVLARLLRTDSNAEVRRVAAWGLQRFATTSVATDALIAALGSDKESSVREMSAWALASARRNAAVSSALGKALRQEKDPEIRTTLIWAIGSIRSCDDVEPLVAALGDANASVRDVAAWSIGSCRPDRAPAALVKALGDADSDVRQSVSWALYMIHDPSTAGAVEAAFRKETDADVREGLIHALGAFGEASVETLQRLVTSPDTTVRKMAVASLANSDGMGPWPWPRPEPRPFP